VTPVPVNPAFHATGAPICGTLTSRVGARRPSRHMLAAPVPVPPDLIAAQAAPVSAWATRVATARMAANSRTTRILRGTAGRGRAVARAPAPAGSGPTSGDAEPV